jgi:hypothetical protein
VWDAIAVLGLERVLHCNHPVVSSLSPNYLGIDLGPNSGLTAPALWDKLAELSSAKKITPLPLAQYVHTGSISPMAAERAGMPDELAPFTPFTDTAIHRLGLRAGAVALHASSTAYDHTGHRTEILMPL